MSAAQSSEVEDTVAPFSRARSSRGSDPLESSLQEIAQALAGLRFGEVRIVVQDSVVVQVDRTEKKRLR